MKTVLLGNTGVQVSALCFGVMSFGGDADEATSAAMYKRCRDAGINFFDCANVYQKGVAEEIMGRLIAGERDEVVITSKVGSRMREGANGDGLSRRHIVREVEESLRRIGTDRLDLYFVHRFDDETPMEETLRALDDLVTQGKIVYPAVSNWAAWQIAKSLGVCAREGLASFACIQPMYSLAKRQAEVEILPLAISEGLAVIPYSPLGGGLLTGKFTTSARADGSRLTTNAMYQKRYQETIYYEIAERFAAHAQERGIHPATLAVAWAAAHPGVTAPIIGARNVDQLTASLASVDVEMTPEWYAEIASLTPEPGVATDRTESRHV